MERVVIFNALSFIGFQLVDTLLNQGIEVIGIDEINSPLKEEMLFTIGRNSNFELLSHYEPKKKVQLCIGCFYNDTMRIVDFNKCESSKIPMIALLSKKSEEKNVVGEKVILTNVYGPWQQSGLTGIEKEKAIYVEDVIHYILSIGQELIDGKENKTKLVVSISFEEGKKKVEEHMQQFHWIYKG